MKNIYEELELEVIRFDSEDVITASGGFNNGNTKGEIGGSGCDIDFTNGGTP